jgi:antitoxin component of MazEF toxin-antitoxin module
MLLLPDDLLEHLNWHEGDVLDLSTTDDGAIRVAQKP